MYFCSENVYFDQRKCVENRKTTEPDAEEWTCLTSWPSSCSKDGGAGSWGSSSRSRPERRCAASFSLRSAGSLQHSPHFSTDPKTAETFLFLAQPSTFYWNFLKQSNLNLKFEIGNHYKRWILCAAYSFSTVICNYFVLVENKMFNTFSSLLNCSWAPKTKNPLAWCCHHPEEQWGRWEVNVIHCKNKNISPGNFGF